MILHILNGIALVVGWLWLAALFLAAFLVTTFVGEALLERRRRRKARAQVRAPAPRPVTLVVCVLEPAADVDPELEAILNSVGGTLRERRAG